MCGILTLLAPASLIKIISWACDKRHRHHHPGARAFRGGEKDISSRHAARAFLSLNDALSRARAAHALGVCSDIIKLVFSIRIISSWKDGAHKRRGSEKRSLSEKALAAADQAAALCLDRDAPARGAAPSDV